MRRRCRAAYRSPRAGWSSTFARLAGFLIVRGECLLLIEGQERPLGQWDFVHCPPRTAHTIVAADRPALTFAVGARKEKGSVRYPVEPVAIAHGACVPDESTSATEVYASFGEPAPGPAPHIFPEPQIPGQHPELSHRRVDWP